MAVIGLIRLIAFATVLAFSLICLGIGANFASIAAGTFIGSGVGGLAVAVGVITLLLIPGIVITDRLRKGAVVSAVWFELVWVGILSILWLACAGHATAQLLGITLSCDIFFDDESISFCRQYQALQAFSWLNWLILFAWFWFLLIMSLIGMSRNKRVWHGPATEIFNKGAPAPPINTASPVGGYAPQQPYGATPYQQPQMTGNSAYPPSAPYQSPQPTGYAAPTGQPYGTAHV